MHVPLGTAAGVGVFFHEHFAPYELVGAVSPRILGGTALTALRR